MRDLYKLRNDIVMPMVRQKDCGLEDMFRLNLVDKEEYDHLTVTDIVEHTYYAAKGIRFISYLVDQLSDEIKKEKEEYNFTFKDAYIKYTGSGEKPDCATTTFDLITMGYVKYLIDSIREEREGVIPYLTLTGIWMDAIAKEMDEEKFLDILCSKPIQDYISKVNKKKKSKFSKGKITELFNKKIKDPDSDAFSTYPSRDEYMEVIKAAKRSYEVESLKEEGEKIDNNKYYTHTSAGNYFKYDDGTIEKLAEKINDQEFDNFSLIIDLYNKIAAYSEALTAEID